MYALPVPRPRFGIIPGPQCPVTRGQAFFVRKTADREVRVSHPHIIFTSRRAH